MSILVSIENLLSGNVVEGTRMEFKKGWNPKTIMRSVCAFANDFENEGSGYIIVGVDEVDGKPIRPVFGFNPNQLESVEKELLGYCNQIKPSYFPRISLEAIDGKNVLVIWVPAGSNRPYKIADDVNAKHKTLNYRIRFNSNSIIPNPEQEAELLQLTAKIPFDDRVNTNASVSDMSFSLMREHLEKTKSRLYEESNTMTVPELAEKMNLSQGTDEHLFPKNVGLLMFSNQPEKFFNGVQIDVVEFPKGVAGKEFNEKIFHGAIQKQLIDVLSYFRTNIIKEKVIKHADKEASDRVFNYPFNAIEEALSNAVYHRNYELQDPIEVRILPEAIEIISFNGADPSLKQDDFDKGIVRARRYRNRRVGEFLKELRLTEGRGTGIPTIVKALKDNGSGSPKFDTNEPHRTHFLIEIPIHPEFKKNTLKEGIAKLAEAVKVTLTDKIDIEVITEKSLARYTKIANSLSNEQKKILDYALIPKKRKEILEDCLGLSNQTKNFNTHIQPLMDLGLINLTIPNKVTSQNQKYSTSKIGKGILYVLKNGNKNNEVTN
ncbi:RNA-binding domain-containing protein [Polaribacter sp.]|uniref:RNA-binding domain-containing protein n=1 Tax=Polaribacter sp. TaxID=1920175 RepID=UPI003EFAE0CE